MACSHVTATEQPRQDVGKEYARCIGDLLNALDSYIPEPKRAIDKPFLMPIEGVHTIEGRGTVATGKIEQGVITVGQKVEILGLGDVLASVVTSVEAFNQPLDKGVAGQNVGLLLRGIKSDQIRRGQVIAAPRMIRPRSEFKGRVYDRRCDLSPDGSLFIYFANKINARTLNDPTYTYAWTAISHPPYFTVLALWPKGDCWHGGGLFLGRRHVWLNHRPEVAIPHPDHRPKRLKVEPNPEAYGEDWPVWSRRMKRDGWTLLQEGEFPITRNGWKTVRTEIWERPCPKSSILLRRSLDAISFKHPDGPYLESFRLVGTACEIPLRDVTWADWDQAGRLVFARAGRLYAGLVEKERVIEQELIDLNPNTPCELEAPPQAKRW